MIIAISLIWIRHKVAGGVESFSRNILDGVVADKSDNSYILLCSRDNVQSFAHYSNDSRFKIFECPIFTANLKDTLYYESFKLDALVSSINADICFVPSYRMPLFCKRNRYVVVIHDLISGNMPQMFKWYRRMWLNFATRRAWKSATTVVTISNFVAHDLLERFGKSQNFIIIYNPILPSKDALDFNSIANKYNIAKGKYFYSVSSIALNKNLITLLKMMKKLTGYKELVDYKLIVSGVGFTKNAKSRFNAEPFLNYVKENGLQDRCIFTGFVSNEERNTLIMNCSLFLFPSVFEGFGMPVIEAMELGANVITTRCASIPEVSQNKANYVTNPYDETEWIEAIKNHCDDTKTIMHFPEYELKNVTDKYLETFRMSVL